MIGIYKIECIKTNRVYVGSSINISVRWRDHLWMLKNNVHHSNALQNAWNKYGNKSFSFETLEELESTNNITEREQYWIDKLEAYTKGYNCRSKADIRQPHDPETKQRISEGTKKGMDNDITHEKLRVSHMGSKCHTSKLTEQQVYDIKIELCKPKINRRTLAKKYNVDISTIDGILAEETWTHVKISGTMYKNIIYKLTETNVIDIKKLLLEGKLTQKQIAEKFGVIQQTISDIKNKKLWSHIS